MSKKKWRDAKAPGAHPTIQGYDAALYGRTIDDYQWHSSQRKKDWIDAFMDGYRKCKTDQLKTD